MATLDKELATFRRIIPTLLAEQGKFALVKGDDLVGTFDTYNDALTAGFEKFKLEPFLVKQIAPAEQVAYFTRAFEATCRA